MTRKRNVIITTDPERNKKFRLYEELVILMGDRVTSSFVPDPLSLCLRATILGELIIQDVIKLGHDNIVIVTSRNTGDCLSEKTLSYLTQEDFTIKSWLSILNGENFSTKYRYQIKKVRRRVYKKLYEKGVLRFKDKMYKQTIKVIDQNAKTQLVEEVMEYLDRKSEGNFRIDILLCCLYFCKNLSSLFSSSPLQKQKTCKLRAEDVVSSYQNYYKRECAKEDMVALLLRALLSK